MEPKCGDQWFLDAVEQEVHPSKKRAVEQELHPSKKRAVEAPISKPESGINMPNAFLWENSSSLQSVRSVPNKFMDRVCGFEITPAILAERNMFVVATNGSNMMKQVTEKQFENDSPVGSSMEGPETGVSFGGIEIAKANQLKDPENVLHTSPQHDLGMSMDQAYSRGSVKTFTSMERLYDMEHGNVTLMGHSSEISEATLRSMCSNVVKGISNKILMAHTYNKGDSNTISSSVYQDVMNALAWPVSSYSLLYERPSVQKSETPMRKAVNLPNGNAVVTKSQAPKSRLDSTSKSNSEMKPARKEAPKSFPANVKSLTGTGMLDGMPVRYISPPRECYKELPGIIKGAGYLCGCQTCNYSNALNAYEFERHAGFKTNHPNNHIHFDNGKTMYQIVQELKSTPKNMLCDAIQTVIGSSINQKAFHAWKESFQAAIGELQQIQAKEELN